MLKNLKKHIFFIILILLLNNCNIKNNYVIEESVNGVLDLTKYSFKNEESHVIKLDGYWEFYWNQPLQTRYDKLFFNHDAMEYVDVPHKWNLHIDEKTKELLGSNGYAIYRAKIILNKIEPVGIKIPSLLSSYKFFIDEELILENGVYGLTKETSIPEINNNYVLFIPKNKEFYFTFFVSNFYHNDGGFITSIQLGNFDHLNNLKTHHIALDLFVSGVLFIMGVYHLSLFFLQRDQKGALYFGLFCILLLIRTLSASENYLKMMIPDLSFEMNYFFVYMSIYFGTYVFNEFVYSLYPEESIIPIKKIINFVSFVLTTCTLFFSAMYYTKALLFFQIFLLIAVFYAGYVFIKAIKNNRVGAKIFLSGFIVFAIFIVNDVLYGNNIINTGYFLTYGFIMFIFSQSFLLTYWFSDGFKKIKELTLDLENKVMERTLDLNWANIQVEQSLYKSKTLNEMISLVIKSKNIDEIFKKIFELFYEKYDLTSYAVYVIDENKEYLDMYKVYDIDILKVNKDYIEILQKNRYEINNKYCVHGACVRYQKSLLIKKVKVENMYEPERENVTEVEINSFYIIPLIHNEECFGTITFANNSRKNSKIQNMEKEEREEIENFIKLVCPSIFQSLEKKELEKAYKDLKDTQMQLIEVEKMASLGSLISTIAHEINNPIAMIKSQLSFIKNNNYYDLNEMSTFFAKLEQNDKEIFFKIAEKSLNNKEFFSTKREREFKKEIQKDLEKFVKNEKKLMSLTSDLLNIKFLPPYEEHFRNLDEDKIYNFIIMISKFKNQIVHIENIEKAIERVSRVVFSLKIFLNTDMSLMKQKVKIYDLVEKTLFIYNNLVSDKIKITKRYESDFVILCKKDNILQIINNIVFNSIQALQNAENKTIQIEVDKVDNLKEITMNMHCSSVYNDTKKEWITISITDSGYGISEENKNKIFSPFFSTKSFGEGIGLGLHVSKKIMDDHEGMIFFSSENNKTQFIVAFPV